ncbi:MAG: hypothetical protein I3270_00680 [Candidatus Moeniiplasma glomeromycotorum]|nr:hypothetical protein [Candidatus Moeniiplasma glomeromycotorum]MCE8162192.1 hypothetical protein [Candidatus Moeniiplasma glomeromycotorum]MCE8166152.1 hypothetical protein [Candidatus Moeniiplasma glomeromycotorum]MCE8166591.1 hypothetical protein [Candidatus Moeniiplasma glomeromycotorum]
MRIKYDKFGTKNIICDNWGEFFTTFKNWHTKNKGVIPPEKIHNEEKFENYVGYEGEGYGDFWERDKEGRLWSGFSQESFLNNREVYSVETVLGTYHKVGSPVNELVVLALNLKVKYNDWKKQEEKAGKVLREIWTTGAPKSTHGLDLYWPKASQPKQPPEEENTPIRDQNQSENYENWTKEQLINKIQQLKSEIEELKNNKVLSICSKQVELKKKQDKLTKLEKSFDSKKTLDNSTNKDNSLSLSAKIAIGSGAVVVLVVLAGIIWRIRKKLKWL